MNKWDLRFLEMVDLVSTWSKDRSTQVGAVIVEPKSRVILSTGYNGMARGIDDDVEARHGRPEKYLWTEHAERNAIFHAARHGIKLEGATMYIRWTPCADCARAIIQAGLARVVCAPVSEDTPEHWRHSFETALDMLHEVGIELYDNRYPPLLSTGGPPSSPSRPAVPDSIHICPDCGGPTSYAPGDETFLPRLMCLPCDRWLTRPRLRRP